MVSLFHTIKYTRYGLPGITTLTFNHPNSAKYRFHQIITDDGTITATLYNKAGKTVKFYTRDMPQEFFGIKQ